MAFVGTEEFASELFADYGKVVELCSTPRNL